MAQVAILEGYKMPRHRRRRTHRRRYGDPSRRRRGGQRSRFAKAAKACSRVVRRRGGSFRACMKKHLKKGR